MTATCPYTEEPQSLPSITTLDLFEVARWQAVSQHILVGYCAAAQGAIAEPALFGTDTLPAGAARQLHITPDNAVLVSTSYATESEGHVVVTGSIGPFPYELHLSFRLDGMAVTVTMEVKKPIPMGPYTWTFRLGGAVIGPAGGVLSATSVLPENFVNSADGGVASHGLDWLCVLRCGGTAILGILVRCLPALVSGGPAGFIACVTSQAGSGAAGIAACVARTCVR